jgi:hypothetical protein
MMMSIKTFFVFLVLLLVMDGCDKNVKLSSHLKENKVIFFSDTKNGIEEVPYYDAIIELKEKYPIEFKNFTVLNPKKDKEKLKEYNITTAPSILIVNQGKQILNVQGKLTSNEIVTLMTHVLDTLHRK